VILLAKQDAFDASDLAEGLTVLFAEVAELGATDAALSLGIDLTTPPAEALAYARERAGELVGMKYVDGKWVTNPNAKFAITDSLREMVRSKVATAIEQGWSPSKLASELKDAFGPARAKTIARTETALAHSKGAATIYEEEEISYVEILDGKGCLPKGHQKGASPPNKSLIGVVQPDKEADGQVWTLAQYQEHLLGHPNCVRSAVPYFES
jgi:hypothetical protein